MHLAGICIFVLLSPTTSQAQDQTALVSSAVASAGTLLSFDGSAMPKMHHDSASISSVIASAESLLSGLASNTRLCDSSVANSAASGAVDDISQTHSSAPSTESRLRSRHRRLLAHHQEMLHHNHRHLNTASADVLSATSQDNALATSETSPAPLTVGIPQSDTTSSVLMATGVSASSMTSTAASATAPALDLRALAGLVILGLAAQL